MQDCCISIANALEILASCTKPSMWRSYPICSVISWTAVWVPFQYPIRPLIVRSREVSQLGDWWFNTLWPRQNGRRFADDTFKRSFVNENVRNFIKISLKFVPKGPINNITALIQIMAWCRAGDKPLSEPMMVKLPTHICVTRPQWVNSF